MKRRLERLERAARVLTDCPGCSGPMRVFIQTEPDQKPPDPWPCEVCGEVPERIAMTLVLPDNGRGDRYPGGPEEKV